MSKSSNSTPDKGKAQVAQVLSFVDFVEKKRALAAQKLAQEVASQVAQRISGTLAPEGKAAEAPKPKSD